MDRDFIQRGAAGRSLSSRRIALFRFDLRVPQWECSTCRGYRIATGTPVLSGGALAYASVAAQPAVHGRSAGPPASRNVAHTTHKPVSVM